MSRFSRADRRHHRNRILAKRYREDKRWSVSNALNEAEWRFHNARRRVNTGTLCSCTLCASPRRLYGNGKAALTRQELRPWD